jgi:hypothetical protein
MELEGSLSYSQEISTGPNPSQINSVHATLFFARSRSCVFDEVKIHGSSEVSFF